MGLYSQHTRSWLDRRFKERSADGVFFSHMPIYGIGTKNAEGNHLGRLARMLHILRVLDGIEFESFLDVGGAEGYLPHLVRQIFGARIATVDISMEACQRARELFGIASASVDSSRLPFIDGAFDVVTCTEVIEHVENPVETILELQRVARVAVILTTDELHYDRQIIDDYLFRRPGWSHMERNLFHPDDIALCFPGAKIKPQTLRLPPLDLLDKKAATDWLCENTKLESLQKDSFGVVVTEFHDAKLRDRKYTDEQLVNKILETIILPGSIWPDVPDLADLLPFLRDPKTGKNLSLIGKNLVSQAGDRYQISNGVPDFVNKNADIHLREDLALRLISLDPVRVQGLLLLRDRLHLPDTWSQDEFDFRLKKDRRGFWSNEQLQSRGEFDGYGFKWTSSGNDPWVLTPCLQRAISAVEIQMRVFAAGVSAKEGIGQLFWKGPEDLEFTEASSVQFRVFNDGCFHTHRIVLKGHPRLSEIVQWLRIDLVDGACEVDLRQLVIY